MSADPPRRLAIAIDGPAGAGKSTVARLVAERLGYLYIDTGAMYRALTLKAIRHRVDPSAVDALACLAAPTEIRLEQSPGGLRVWLDDEDVTVEIRGSAVTQQVAAVAANPAVREQMVRLQRAMAEAGGVVMDGRDIGSHVLPGADRKFFLDASLAERAARRRAELAARGLEASLAAVMADIAERDRLDSTRSVAPLRQVPEAIFVDTTGLPIVEVVNRILAHCQ